MNTVENRFCFVNLNFFPFLHSRDSGQLSQQSCSLHRPIFLALFSVLLLQTINYCIGRSHLFQTISRMLITLSVSQNKYSVRFLPHSRLCTHLPAFLWGNKSKRLKQYIVYCIWYVIQSEHSKS